MRAINQKCLVLIAGLALLVSGRSSLAGPAKPEPTGASDAKSSATKIAVPSQAAPFKWSNAADFREVEQIPQAEQERLAVEFLRAFHPLRLKQIKQMKNRAPNEYYEVLRDSLRERMEAERLRLGNPDEFQVRLKELELNARCEQMAIAYQSAPADKRPAIEKQLKDLMNKAFEARQASMEQRLKGLEREYLRLKSIVEKRRKYRELVIDFQMLRMLGEGEVFEMW